MSFDVVSAPDEFTIVDGEDDWVIYTKQDTEYTLEFVAVGMNDAAAAVAAAAEATAAAASIMNMIPPGGTTGQALVKASDSDYDFAYGASGGGGDMLAAVYDPTGVANDAFARANHTGSQLAATISDFSTAADARISAAIGTTVQAYSAQLGQIAALAAPGADRILFWDHSALAWAHLTLGTNLSITGTTLNASVSGGGGGDMLASMYDPTNVQDDAFARANHHGTQLASTISDFSTAADARIAAAVGVSVQAYSPVLAATTASFLIADEAKLDGIEPGADVTDAANVDAAGAVMNTDTSTAAMSFGVDEDDMASNSATKFPSQQSVKAYVDNKQFVVFPEDYGAVGDNAVTDDQAAFNAALAAVIAGGGGAIQLKAKRYRLSAPLAGNIGETHVAIVGLGRDISELVFDSGVNGLDIDIDGSDWESGGHFRWDHFTLATLGNVNAVAATFNGTRSSGESTSMVSSIGVKMKGVDTTLHGWADGAVHVQCQGVNYYRPEFLGKRNDYSANAFEFGGINDPTEVSLTSPVVYWAGAGVDISGSVEGVIITDPIFVAVAKGVYHHTSPIQEPQFQVKGGHINAHTAGVHSETGHACLVEGCLIFEWPEGGGTRWDGIRFQNGYNNVIVGNQIFGWNTAATTRRAISLETCTRTATYGNVIQGYTSSFKFTHGIYDDSTARSVATYGNVFDDDTVAVRSNSPSYYREKLRANLTLYVRSDATGSGNGLANTADGAFLTCQAALDWVLQNLDLGGYDVQISVAAGTYAAGVTMLSPQVGKGNILFQGDNTTPSNVTIGAVQVSGAGARLFLSGLNISKGDGQYCVRVDSGGYVNAIGKCRFSSTSAGHRILVDNGTFDATGNEEIEGTVAGGHYWAQNGGRINVGSAKTWTSVGTAVQGYFAYCQTGGTIFAFANTASGTFSGYRYGVAPDSSIQTNLGGIDYFPGSAPGSARGGWYDNWMGLTPPVTKTANFALAETEDYIINNKAGSALVVTLPSAASYPGRSVTFKTIVAQAINSASSNVVPLASATAGTAIVAGTAGRWARLVSDGTNWVIMEGA